MILRVGRAAITHDILEFIRPALILVAQLIVPYRAILLTSHTPRIRAKSIHFQPRFLFCRQVLYYTLSGLRCVDQVRTTGVN